LNIFSRKLESLKTYNVGNLIHKIGSFTDFESLLRLGFEKTKHDPDIWIVNQPSHHKLLAIYVNDILIWSKDLITVIKSLEKTYMLKNVGIPEYHLGGDVEFLGDAWKNQGLGLALSAENHIQ
jgi:hypothetical protein